MVIIKVEANEIAELFGLIPNYEKGVGMLIFEIINKYFPDPHRINVEAMAEGYKEMGEINLSIANGDSQTG